MSDLIERVAGIVRQGYAPADVARAAVREVLVRMREESRDSSLWRRTVRRIVNDFAERHGVELPPDMPA